MKKTIAISTFLAAATAFAAPKTYEEAIQQLTGPNQAQSGELHELCLKVNPYFISSLTPTGGVSAFHSLIVSGTDTWAADKDGGCAEPDYKTGLCEVGYVKVVSTAPLACNVPVGL